MSVVASADYLPFIGRSLSVAERTALLCSLPLLAHRCNAPVTATQWWGKVCGYRADYHIACVRGGGSNDDDDDDDGGGDAAHFFGVPTYFYSTDGGNTWTLLPDVTDAQAMACERLRGVFRGVPSYEYRLRDLVPPPAAQATEAAAAAAAVNGDGTATAQSLLPAPDALLVEAAAAVRETAAAAAASRSASKRNEGNNDDEYDGDDNNNDDDDDDEEGEEEEVEEDDEEDAEAAAAAAAAERRRRKAALRPKTIIVSLREVVRLAHFVRLHDAACRLVVRGEYLCPRSILHSHNNNNNNNNNTSCDDNDSDATNANVATVATTTHTRGVRNGNFSGQALPHALRPSCYLKAGRYGDARRNATLYGPTYNVHTDYLAPITDDAPPGVWSVKYDATQNVVVVRNLWFDGALFCYRPGTTERCQAYYGDGQRALDLCFML